MQIMNLKILAKKLWWAATAFKTINNLPDSIIFVNSEGNITRFNKKAREVFNLNEPKEDTVIEFNCIVRNGMDAVRTSLESSKPVLATAYVAGREFYVELNVSRSGSGYCINLRDMTKLTNEIVNDDKTLKFNNEKNAMLVKLEGDIKSPITSIHGFSQGLLDGLGGTLTEKQAKYVKIINSNAEDLYHFVDKLLEFSNAESSIYQPDYHNFDIVEAIKTVIKEFEEVLIQKKLNIDFDYEILEKRTGYTDFNAISRAIRNILEIAISMTETGFIRIKITNLSEETAQNYNLRENLKSYLQINIQDTGAGVPKEDLKYLCEPYAQLEKGKKNFLRALELGSASILIKRANGIIDIRSELMKGTEYNIILPIEKA